MNFSNITTGLTHLSKAALKTLEHHSPKILMALGIGAGVGATVMACKATLKLETTMDAINADIQAIRDAAPEDAAADKEHTKALAATYISGGVKLAKLYGPSIAMGATSIACVLAGNKIMNDRYIGAVAAVNSAEQMLSNYRSRVIAEFGEEKDAEFHNGVVTEVIEEPVLDKNGIPKTDKNGEVKTTKRTERHVDEDLSANKYSRMFDEVSTKQWDPDVEYNKSALLLKQEYFNQQLRSQNYLTLNDVYKALGFPVTAYGQDIGWVIDKDTPNAIVDLGLFAMDEKTGLRRIDNMDQCANAVLLTFEGCRYIKDKIYRCQRIW